MGKNLCWWLSSRDDLLDNPQCLDQFGLCEWLAQASFPDWRGWIENSLWARRHEEDAKIHPARHLDRRFDPVSSARKANINDRQIGLFLLRQSQKLLPGSRDPAHFVSALADCFLKKRCNERVVFANQNLSDFGPLGLWFFKPTTIIVSASLGASR